MNNVSRDDLHIQSLMRLYEFLKIFIVQLEMLMVIQHF